MVIKSSGLVHFLFLFPKKNVVFLFLFQKKNVIFSFVFPKKSVILHGRPMV